MFIRLKTPGQSRTPKAIVPRKYRGDTMIEVLLTVLILAVGVLGVAAMQVTTYKNLSSSHSASVAAIAADDFAERMRANGAEVLADTYNHSADPGAAFANCADQVCTTPQLAAYDIGSWWLELGTNLPLAKGQVARIAATNTFTVTVRWDEDRSGSTGVLCPMQSAADLECYQFNVTL
jgi:type IV pilus assembly protein PilV